MITLLHGDNIEASRAELNHIKTSAKGRDIRILDGRTLELVTLVQSLESSSLFGGETLVVIDRLFAKIGRQQKRIEELCRLLAGSAITSDIVLWEDKEVGTTVVKNLGQKAVVRLFKLPVLIFQFLDGIRSGNAKTLLVNYHELTRTEAPELVFSMMVKRVRQLIQLTDGVTPEGLAGWQASRLTTQAKSFTMEKLVGIYKQLHDIETYIKTGTSAFSLSSHIEQWIVSL